MNLKYLLCILIFTILRGIVFSQDKDVSNLYLIDKLIDESLVPLENVLEIRGKDVLYNLILNADNIQQTYFSESIKKKFPDFGFLTNLKENVATEKKIVNVFIKNPEIKVRYTGTHTDNFLGSKIVERVVSVKYEIKLLNSDDSSVVYSDKFSKKIKSNFNINNIAMVEDERFPFTKSVIPDEDTLNKLILPAVVILASAAAVILFFTIRSK
ncbi:MAG: hypothetical protein HGGPFJEG_01928 [Ignavibacteria bacterium]|nr:hypothetical protein [Ignavibacteria bacterium]